MQKPVQDFPKRVEAQLKIHVDRFDFDDDENDKKKKESSRKLRTSA